ncbi:DUF1007 family protein [Aquabacter spiritensis]|uniref:ABC-type uncharacterized transport system substrate-binding protein n=1 Tax=Aquabacter spiritensis TaxID=933073 RepID=A0A4R3M3D3_9HYPH|nr:DUF1007 family protein [Aquabacter spiritensis]TCT07744.1 ABC-type uncharacterized transport system substrate-binding protein [Aquabacter spiritensis]
MAYRFAVRLFGGVLILLGAMGAALAHPHVWVTMRTDVVYGPDGMMTGLKQAWTFDEAFTAFALQGMARNKDGSYPDSVLKPLAEVNVTSLKEYDYFVKGKTAKAGLVFKDPVDYSLTFANDALTLHFVLPLEKPVPAKGSMTFDIYDPTYFVAFAFAEAEPVRLSGAPAGCSFKVVTPDQPQTMQLGESFFSDLTASSTYGAQYADKIQVRCP